jgi:predicted enzyme related to lactoylglutathione lyase
MIAEMGKTVVSKEDWMSEQSTRGRFVWYDLMTPDSEAAKAFYTAVMGWGTQTWEEMQPPYTMWTSGDQPIGGIMSMPPEAVAGGARPHWLAYVAVPDVDATVASAKEKGATVMVEPRDIPTVGRFAVIADPQGAMIAPFCSTSEAPPEPKGPPPVGEFTWHELATPEPEATWGFYSSLFGWEKTEAMDMGPHGVYQMFGRGGISNGAVFKDFGANEGRTAWLHYARVADIKAAIEAARAGGGQVEGEPMEVPGGDLVIKGTDSQGGPFALHEVKSAQG